jgi:hypothetical protein
LNDQVAHQELFGLQVSGVKSNGQLNPDWVEWMMGFPVGWTEIGGE